MSGGVASALEQVLDGQADGAALDQAGLFDLDAEETGALDAASPLTTAITPPKRRGRPPGAKNRRTEAVVGWLLSQGRHPLSVMMEVYSMPPLDLARRIGIANPNADQLLDLLKLQLRMAEAVAPYVAQRQPQAVQVDAKGSLSISFEGVSFPARASGPGNLDGGEVIEGEAMSVRLPFKSDAPSRTDDATPSGPTDPG